VPCFEDGTENKEGNSYSAQDEAKTLTAKDAVLKGVHNPKKKKKSCMSPIFWWPKMLWL
jgi:hypothetical protein